MYHFIIYLYLLGVAVAFHAGEGGVDFVFDADIFVDTYLDAAEAAFERDDGTVHDVGTTQVEADVSEAGMHLGSFKTLAAVAVVLLAEAHVDFVHLAAVHDDRLRLAGGMAMAATVLFAEEQQRDAPYHSHEADDVFPNIGPEDDIAGCQKQQDADAETDDGTCFALVVEDVDETGHNDEERPPAFEVDMNNIQEFQSPDDSEGQKGDAADDFACLFHDVMFFSLISVLSDGTAQRAGNLAAAVAC